MEKDPSLYQDTARTVTGDGLGAEGMEAQVRLGLGGTHSVWGGGGTGWGGPSSGLTAQGITHSWTIS